jgi:hypothetical protein
MLIDICLKVHKRIVYDISKVGVFELGIKRVMTIHNSFYLQNYGM